MVAEAAAPRLSDLCASVRTFSTSGPFPCGSDSSTLAMYKTFLAVIRPSGLRIFFSSGENSRARTGFAGVELVAAAAENFGAADGFLVAGSGQAFGFIQRRGNGFQVGQRQLGVDGIDIPQGIDAAFDMQNLATLEATDDVENRIIDFAEYGRGDLLPRRLLPWKHRETMPAISTTRTAAGIIFFGGNIGGDLLQARIGHGDNADIGLDRGKRIIGGESPGGMVESVKEGAFTDVGQTDDADF